MSKYPKIKPGEWVTPKTRWHKIVCCDCGLVHLFQFRVEHKRGRHTIKFRAWRDERATGQVRRWMKRKIKKGGGNGN